MSGGVSSPPWTILRVLDWTAQKFQEAQIDGARLEAQVLLAHTLACKRIELYTHFDRPLAEPELASYRGLIRRRLAGEPLAYLVGEHEFWSLPLYVDESVLVPRSDTETLIEVALARLGKGPGRVLGSTPRDEPDAAAAGAGASADGASEGDAGVAGDAGAAPASAEAVASRGGGRLLDLCTGSGAIAIALLHELSSWTGVATDVSPSALAIARRNAERNAVADRLELRQGDLWSALPSAGATFQLIASNPPYVNSAVIDTLSAEVRREPRLALDGGPDGLVFYDRILAAAAAHLAPGGWLVLEHGYDQAEAVASRLTAAGFEDVTTAFDLGKNPRITAGRRPA
jgi:release factor glutamine methyltransferase